MDIGVKTTFWKLINKQYNCIVIPEIQRDYVQGKNTLAINDIRDNFLNDIYSALANNTSLDLNFVYGKSDNSEFVPIDGQQRLTTLFLLHLFAFAKEHVTRNILKLKKALYYRTRTSTFEFIQKLCENIGKISINDNLVFNISDAAWFRNEWLLDPSVTAMLNMLDDIYKKFKDFDYLSDALTKDDCPVTFMSLDIQDIGRENDLYIKMNARGRALTSFECFKSELYDHIEKNLSGYANITDFKKKIDDDWLDLLWFGFGLEENSDPLFMDLIHFLLFDNYIFINDLRTFEKDQTLVKIDKNQQALLYSFRSYVPLIDINSLTMIAKFFDLLLFVRDNHSYYFNIIKDDILNQLTSDNDKDKRHYLSRMYIRAIVTYAQGTNYDITSFEEWYRIARNFIVSAGNIDKPEAFCTALKVVGSNFNGSIGLNTPNNDLISHSDDISFFSTESIQCEVLKAKIIIRDNAWLDGIRKAEQNAYFHSSISFLFWLQDVDYDNVDQATLNLPRFQEDCSTMSLFFDNDGLVKQFDSDLFRRGLLTFGNYSFNAKYSDTFSFEGGNRYYDFLKMLNIKQSFQIFKLCFEAYKQEYQNNQTSLATFLKDRVDSFTDQSNEFIYWVVKEPELLKYAKENRFSVLNNNNKTTILLSKSILSAAYCDYYTYLLYSQLIRAGHQAEYHSGKGRLDLEDSRSYVENIDGQRVHIETLWDNNELVISSDVWKTPTNPRIVINSFDDLKNYVCNEYGIAHF